MIPDDSTVTLVMEEQNDTIVTMIMEEDGFDDKESEGSIDGTANGSTVECNLY